MSPIRNLETNTIDPPGKRRFAIKDNQRVTVESTGDGAVYVPLFSTKENEPILTGTRLTLDLNGRRVPAVVVANPKCVQPLQPEEGHENQSQ